MFSASPEAPLEICNTFLNTGNWVKTPISIYCKKAKILIRFQIRPLILCGGYKKDDWVQVDIISKKDLDENPALLKFILFELICVGHVQPLCDPTLPDQYFVDIGRFGSENLFMASCFVNPNYPEGYEEKNVLRRIDQGKAGLFL